MSTVHRRCLNCFVAFSPMQNDVSGCLASALAFIKYKYCSFIVNINFLTLDQIANMKDYTILISFSNVLQNFVYFWRSLENI